MEQNCVIYSWCTAGIQAGEQIHTYTHITDQSWRQILVRQKCSIMKAISQTQSFGTRHINYEISMAAHQIWSYVQFILKMHYCWITHFTFLNAFISILLNAWMCMENTIFRFISIWKKYFSNLLIGSYCKWYNCSWLLILTINKKVLQIHKLRRQHKCFLKC